MTAPIPWEAPVRSTIRPFEAAVIVVIRLSVPEESCFSATMTQADYCENGDARLVRGILGGPWVTQASGPVYRHESIPATASTFLHRMATSPYRYTTRAVPVSGAGFSAVPVSGSAVFGS